MRRVALVVLLLTAAAACGSDQDPAMDGQVPDSTSSSSSSTSSSTSTSSPAPSTVPPPDAGVCTGSESGSAEDATLAVAHGPLRSGAAVTWTLTVTNGGDSDLELVFGSGQDGDVTLSRDGEEVYRWSDGMAFTQVVRCQVLAPGEVATYQLAEPDLDVEPGEYQLRASLAAQPKPADVVTSVTVEG